MNLLRDERGMVPSDIDSGYGLTSPGQSWPRRTTPFGPVSSLIYGFQSIYSMINTTNWNMIAWHSV